MDLFNKKKQTEVNNISPLQADQEAKSKLYAQPEAIPEPPATPIAPVNPSSPSPQDMKPPVPVAPVNPIAPLPPTNPTNPAPQAMTPLAPPAPATPSNTPPLETAEPPSRFSALRSSLGMRAESPRQNGMEQVNAQLRREINMAPGMSLGRSNPIPLPVQNTSISPANRIAPNPGITRAADRLSRIARRQSSRASKMMQQSTQNMKKVRK